MDTIVDGSNRQEPVDLYFPADDLFEPFKRRRGLPIGNLTSQLSANLYLDGFDHWVTEVLGAPYVRYVDDFALFHDDPAVLAEWRALINHYLAARRLKLHPRKTVIAPAAQPALFLGFELAPCKLRLGRRCAKSRARRLPEDNIHRFRGRLRGLRDRYRAGTIVEADVKARVGAWMAHAKHANTFRLRQAIFQGGWFDPIIRQV